MNGVHLFVKSLRGQNEHQNNQQWPALQNRSMINVSSSCFSTGQKRLCLLMFFLGIRKGRFFLCCVGVNQKWYDSKGQKLDDAVPMHFSHTTVDSSEIRRSPVDMVVYPLHLQGFYQHPNGGWPWDFWLVFIAFLLTFPGPRYTIPNQPSYFLACRDPRFGHIHNVAFADCRCEKMMMWL